MFLSNIFVLVVILLESVCIIDCEEFRNIETRREYVKKNFLPSKTICGLQHTDDRILFEGAETALDAFPWLVHIKSSESEDTQYEYGDRCHGVLISNGYVLTDAYCGYDAKIVKLGQYSTAANVSCVKSSQSEKCTEHTVYVKVEEKIRSGKRENGAYDFMLLRLAKKVTFSDYIRPICLPVDGSLRPPSETSLLLSGWGAKDSGAVQKKRLPYDVTNEKTCYDTVPGLKENIELANVSLACLVPNKANTVSACNGDHGGPLMYKHKNQWFVDGIIIQVFANEAGTYNANFNSCSNKDPVTGIFITPTFMNWILDNIIN